MQFHIIVLLAALGAASASAVPRQACTGTYVCPPETNNGIPLANEFDNNPGELACFYGVTNPNEGPVGPVLPSCDYDSATGALTASNIFQDGECPTVAEYDLGPMSAEILLAGLSSCVAHVYLITAASMDVPLTSLDVEAHGSVDLRGGQIGYDEFKPGVDNLSYDVYVSSPAPKEKIEELHEQVERICPVLNTFLRPNKVESRLYFSSSKTEVYV
ncbi:hypothetical protein CALVIDRAFT_595124 [Calocera viscosa TUFC12733]|uniref:OsmC-like protein n=1 Tax=Calocera viscosa (strain TUFC12733) TaxID=1330018 RepID=A0A167RJX8_CALVF|nr:hypothetical protein CALVIDRAFT_595124 [Calocera viscosa TUFC12733]